MYKRSTSRDVSLSQRSMLSCTFQRFHANCLMSKENKEKFAHTKANLEVGCLFVLPYLLLVISVK